MKLKFLLFLITFSTLNAFSNNSLLEDNLEYSARVEGDYVYVNLSTSDRNSMLSMIRRGFSVYFDLKGKKKKKIAVTYVIPPEQPNQRGQRPQGGRQNQDLPINQMLSLMPNKALFTYYNDKVEFQLSPNSLDISLDYNYKESSNGTNDKLLYTLKIPVSKIAPNGEKLNKLSIGIVSNTAPTNRNGINNQNRNGARQGGGQGRSGARQGGGQGGRPNRGQGGNQNQRPQLTAFSLWFDCDIK
ncbi:hypothetical protein [Winogradskyella immobilis]|uniref:Uncharacterized protein n=1 Tax=Winogradskyella immobilis TaxID=2816852 RepID=A0ABS8EPI4_9FLAO|nr:hypothetical protein [Winogradskyella immobilis]MCC1485068.1 hypothetical protein [Winogradskyella immobilis]MCG0017160.1 hypothetical protein [Winogradskyella immobilis]